MNSRNAVAGLHSSSDESKVTELSQSQDDASRSPRIKLADIIQILAEIYPEFPTDAGSSRPGCHASLELHARQIEFLACKSPKIEQLTELNEQLRHQKIAISDEYSQSPSSCAKACCLEAGGAEPAPDHLQLRDRVAHSFGIQSQIAEAFEARCESRNHEASEMKSRRRRLNEAEAAIPRRRLTKRISASRCSRGGECRIGATEVGLLQLVEPAASGIRANDEPKKRLPAVKIQIAPDSFQSQNMIPYQNPIHFQQLEQEFNDFELQNYCSPSGTNDLKSEPIESHDQQLIGALQSELNRAN